MADYIRTIPQELFNMEFFRKDNQKDEPECKTIGCVAGHCTTIFPEIALNTKYEESDRIDFVKFSYDVLDIKENYKTNDLWAWIYGFKWTYHDNTPEGAARRIEYAIHNGIPDDFEMVADSEHMSYYVKKYNDWYEEFKKQNPC